MNYRVVPVDIRQPKVVQLLIWLQKVCLPADKVYPIAKGYWYVVYTQDGQAAGFAGIVPSARWSDTMYLCRAGVVLSHRGRGLQKKLNPPKSCIRKQFNSYRFQNVRAISTLGFQNGTVLEVQD